MKDSVSKTYRGRSVDHLGGRCERDEKKLADWGDKTNTEELRTHWVGKV